MPLNKLPLGRLNLSPAQPSTVSNTQSNPQSSNTQLPAVSTDQGSEPTRHVPGAFLRRSILYPISHSAPSKLLQQAIKLEKSGDLNKLQALLRENPALFTETDNRGNNLLALSVKNPQATQAILFLAQLLRPEAMDAIVNNQNHEGSTALTLALKTKKLESTAILLGEAELDLRLTNNQGENALHLAVKNTTPEIVTQMLLHPSAQTNGPEILNHQDRNGQTPLLMAVCNGNPEMVDTLLQHPDIDVNLPDNNRQTPLHMAVKWGKVTTPSNKIFETKKHLISSLLSHPSIQPNLPNKSGNTPLHSAIKEAPWTQKLNHFNLEWVQQLAESPKVNPNQRDATGQTPLESILKMPFIYYSSDGYAPARVDSLLSAFLRNPNIDPNLPDREGRTPVWQAMEIIERQMNDLDVARWSSLPAPLATLAKFSSKVDFNRQYNEQTIMGKLLTPATHHKPSYYRRVVPMLGGLLALKELQQHLDYNAPAISGKTMIEFATYTPNKHWLVRQLVKNPRVDFNVLTSLRKDRQQRHAAYQYLELYDNKTKKSLITASDFDRVEMQILAKWAAYRNADGSESKFAANTNYLLGTLLAQEERHHAAQTSTPVRNADNDACATLTLALKQCLKVGKTNEIPQFANALLELPLRQPEHFNLNSMTVTRSELQQWAEGRVPMELLASVSSNALDSTRSEELLRNDEMHEVRNEAANTITRHMRAHIAKEAYNELEASELWKHCKAALVNAGKLQASENLSAPQLSAMNIRALRQKLGRLTESEAALYEAFMQKKFFATHFTDQRLDKPSSHDKTLSLFAQDKLQKKGIIFSNSTGKSMFDWSADNKFVFFALECGEKPKKLDSRYYGHTVYRVPFDAPVFQQTAWGGLDYSSDKLRPDRDPKKHFAGMNDQEADTIKTVLRRQTRDLHQPEAYDDIFVGKDLIEGAALTAISRIRALTEAQPDESGKLPPLAKRLLNSKTDAEIDGLLNGIFRPMIRVPIQMITDTFGKWDADALAPLKMEHRRQQYQERVRK